MIPKPRTDTIWVGDFSSLKPSDFGTPSFHGRFHPEIVAQGILRYLPEESRSNALVWDVMSGGGTTGDVCSMFGVPCLMTDLNPVRSDVTQWSGEWLPPEVIGGVDLLVLHPPYWDAVAYGTPMDQAGTLEEYLCLFRGLVRQVTAALKPGGHAILVIGNVYKDKELVPLDALCSQIMRDEGYKIRGKIVKDFGETKGGHKRGAALWRYRALKFGFWEFGHETVYYLKR